MRFLLIFSGLLYGWSFPAPGAPETGSPVSPQAVVDASSESGATDEAAKSGVAVDETASPEIHSAANETLPEEIVAESAEQKAASGAAAAAGETVASDPAPEKQPVDETPDTAENAAVSETVTEETAAESPASPEPEIPEAGAAEVKENAAASETVTEETAVESPASPESEIPEAGAAEVKENAAVSETVTKETAVESPASPESEIPEAGAAEVKENAAASETVTEETAVESPASPESEIPKAGAVDAQVESAPTTVAEEAPASTIVAETAPASGSLLKATEIEFFAGGSLMNFDYTEFDTDNSWLDDEKGALPGVLLGSVLHWPNAYISLALNYHFGDVTYRGQTQSVNPDLSGLPINSRSDTDIFDTTVIAGYQFSTLTAYGGVGYYFWRRNIRPTTTDSGLSVAGILEFYSWTYALIGLNTPLVKNDEYQLDLDIRVTRMLRANMEADFQGFGGYDNAMLNLGEDWGLRLAFPWRFRSSGQSTITVEPYYTTWNLKRSAVTELSRGGVGAGSGVVEPRSETRNFGILVYIRFLM